MTRRKRVQLSVRTKERTPGIWAKRWRGCVKGFATERHQSVPGAVSKRRVIQRFDPQLTERHVDLLDLFGMGPNCASLAC